MGILSLPYRSLTFSYGDSGVTLIYHPFHRYTCAGIELYAQRISTNSYLAISKAWRAVLMMKRAEGSWESGMERFPCVVARAVSRHFPERV